MNYTTLYDKAGNPVAWINEKKEYAEIYLFNGQPVAWISEDSIYSYDGQHLGWFESGWVLDHDGNIVLFSQDVAGGPYLPARQPSPARDEKWASPDRSAKQSSPLRPYYLGAWSSTNFEKFFMLKVS
jgi:hypothetical protein